ncbi:hypothetical protein DL95DRAFT_461272 [Leptodontidium sp. 2 PMI_412]|nr:hypothetical protein DL95DRAFT_461272 [Leptodontidium sp. 2 PMI_412]
MNDIKVIQPNVQYDSNGDQKSVLSDDALLLSMGKEPELRSTDQVMMMCSWSCNVVLYSTVFDIGGPIAMGTLIVAVGQTLLIVSLAEFCSIWPTAGGQQYYTQALATGKFRPFLSYLVGWAVLVGEISTGSPCAPNSAQVTASFVEVTHPDFVWKPWLTWVVYCVFIIGPIVQNLAPKYLPALNVFGAFWTIGGGLAWAISFLVMAPKKSSGFVFKMFINNTGYASKGS